MYIQTNRGALPATETKKKNGFLILLILFACSKIFFDPVGTTHPNRNQEKYSSLVRCQTYKFIERSPLLGKGSTCVAYNLIERSFCFSYTYVVSVQKNGKIYIPSTRSFFLHMKIIYFVTP